MLSLLTRLTGRYKELVVSLALNYKLTDSLIHTLTYSLTHSLTHSSLNQSHVNHFKNKISKLYDFK